jgi:hypothetical protein
MILIIKKASGFSRNNEFLYRFSRMICYEGKRKVICLQIMIENTFCRYSFPFWRKKISKKTLKENRKLICWDGFALQIIFNVPSKIFHFYTTIWVCFMFMYLISFYFLSAFHFIGFYGQLSIIYQMISFDFELLTKKFSKFVFHSSQTAKRSTMLS